MQATRLSGFKFYTLFISQDLCINQKWKKPKNLRFLQFVQANNVRKQNIQYSN